MTRRTRVATPPILLGLLALAVAPGCGGREDDTERVQGALGTFGSLWFGAGSVDMRDAPAIARTAGTSLTMYGWG